MKNNRLRRILDEREERKNFENPNSMDINREKLIPFDLDGNSYFVALRDNVLVFDNEMALLYTLEYNMLEGSQMPLFKKVNEIISVAKLSNAAEYVKLNVKREGVYESISFTSRFDATFIFRKLKRVASRAPEGIEELSIEKDGVIIDSFIPAEGRNFKFRNHFLRNNQGDNPEKLELVSTLVRVEDTIDAMIGSKMNNMAAEVSASRIDKCIELLEKAKTQL